MGLKKQNVLLFSRTMGQGGAEMVILQLCRILVPYVNKVVVCSSGGVNVNALEKMGVKHYYIPDIEKKSVLRVIQNIRILNQIIVREKITVIHAHHRMAAFYAKLVNLRWHLYLINTVHNVFDNRKFLTKFSYKGTAVIACGQNVKRNLVHFFDLNFKQVTVIHNAVAPFNNRIIALPQLVKLRADGYLLVGNVGRLSEQKGMSYFIEALPQVKRVISKVKFVIIGDGEEHDRLIAQANRLNVGDDVLFLGYQANIRSIEKQLDFIVLSSLWEGLPLTPIEAFSVKKTVIGTNIGGTNEVICNGHDGLLVPPEDSNALAEKIIYLSQNPRIRNELEQNAKQTFEANYNIKVFQDSIICYYQRVLVSVDKVNKL